MPLKKNPYSNYMAKRRKEMESEGRKFPGGWKEVADAVASEWEVMTAEQKQPFKVKRETPIPTKTDETPGTYILIPKEENVPDREEGAVGLPPQVKGVCEMSYDRLDCQGNSIRARIEASVRYKYCLQRYEQNMERLVTERDNVPDMVFMIIGFNLWGRTNDGRIIPSEIALIAFSIRQGVIDQYATPIDPGKLELGMDSQARAYSDALNIPVPPFDEECQEYDLILDKITEFKARYTDNHSPGVFFCLKKLMNVAYGCLAWLCDQAEVGHNYQLYPFESMVKNLTKQSIVTAICRDLNPEEVLALSEDTDVATLVENGRLQPKFSDLVLQRNAEKCSVEMVPTVIGLEAFTYTDEQILTHIDKMQYAHLEFFGCLHHMTYSDVIHNCALNKLNRLAFRTMDMVMGNFGIKPTLGVNYIDIKRTGGELRKRREILEMWGLETKTYENYITPREREEEKEREKENAKEDPVEPIELVGEQYIPLLFRKKETLPEFEPFDPNNPRHE